MIAVIEVTGDLQWCCLGRRPRSKEGVGGGIDEADGDEHEISEVSREEPLNREHGVYAETGESFDQNDRWTATFVPGTPGRYVYAIEAWTDLFGSWRRDFLLKPASNCAVTARHAWRVGRKTSVREPTQSLLS